jgi:phage-related holin
MDREIVHSVLEKMGDTFNFKVITGAVLGLVTNKYSILMVGFGVLLFIDILTKWIAISYAYLVEQGNENPAFFDAVKGVNSARRARKINSYEMRKRSVSKLFVYIICFLMAAIFDLMSMASGSPSQIVNIVCGYLAMNEILSVIENLGDAGVQSMGRLYELLKRRGKS